MTDAEWSVRLKGSAMRRAGVRRIRRSLALAAAHLPPADASRVLTAMAGQPSAAHPDVREAITWALAHRAAEGGPLPAQPT